MGGKSSLKVAFRCIGGQVEVVVEVSLILVISVAPLVCMGEVLVKDGMLRWGVTWPVLLLLWAAVLMR